jgi:hypothetical protein
MAIRSMKPTQSTAHEADRIASAEHVATLGCRSGDEGKRPDPNPSPPASGPAQRRGWGETMTNQSTTSLAILSSEDVVRHAPDPASAVVALLGQARAWLEEAVSLDDVSEFIAKAEAIRTYTAQAKLGAEAEVAATEIVRRARWKLGELMGPAPGAGPGRGKVSDDRPFSKQETYELRQEAAVPKDKFEEALGRAREERRPLSRRSLMQQVKEENAAAMEEYGIKPPTDPDEIAAGQRRSEILGALLGATDHVLKMAERYSPADVALLSNDRIWPNCANKTRQAIAYLTEILEMP